MPPGGVWQCLENFWVYDWKVVTGIKRAVDRHASKHPTMNRLVIPMLAKVWSKRNLQMPVEVESVSPSLKKSLAVSHNVKHEVIRPDDPIDGYLPKRNENVRPCIAMFIARFILFGSATNWEEPKCPSTGK